MGIWVKVGTRHESPKVAGVSHYLEHMLFKGTKRRSALDIALEVDQVGGEFNAFTSREHTCFYILVLDRDWELGLDILTDVLLNSEFQGKEVERERKVVLQEIAMIEESPEEMAHDLYFEKVYSNEGLGRPILGTAGSIQKMKRSELVQFFREHYRPEELVVSIAGDVSHEAVLKKLRPLSRPLWPGRVKSKLPENNPKKSRSLIPQQEGFWWYVRPAEQVHLIWGVPGPHFSSEDRFSAFLLNVYLGGGMSSSLFQEIREKNGLAYNVYSSLTPFVDSGVFTIYAATGVKQIPLCLKLIEKCVQQIKDKKLSRHELKVIQDNLKGTVLLSSDSVESRMSSIAKNEIFLGKYVSVKEVCDQIDQVTPEDLRRVANHLFRDEKRSIVALGPKPSQTVITKLRPVVLR